MAAADHRRDHNQPLLQAITSIARRGREAQHAGAASSTKIAMTRSSTADGSPREVCSDHIVGSGREAWRLWQCVLVTATLLTSVALPLATTAWQVRMHDADVSSGLWFVYEMLRSTNLVRTTIWIATSV